MVGSGSTWAVNVIIVKHRVSDRRNFLQNNSVKSGSVGAASNVSLLELHENGTYLSHYVLTSTQKCVYPPIRRQKRNCRALSYLLDTSGAPGAQWDQQSTPRKQAPNVKFALFFTPQLF